ncbi:hypothetical protein F5146DRAFT_1144183 [Armillaria mellea]|nr:hypothetical protein F5146DRAFT_1144183 [Armillaria mellea]
MTNPTWQPRSWHVAHNFRSFLRSNRYPLDSELTAIKNAIANAQSHLCRGIAGGDTEELCEEEADIEAFLIVHKGFISAIRRFPREILCEIFCHILDMYRMVASPNEAPNIFSHTQYPRVLGLVCSEWRTVSIGLPPLWSRVNLQNQILLSRNPEKMLTTCLERSEKHSLEIVIALQDYWDVPSHVVSVQDCPPAALIAVRSAGSPSHSLMAHNPASSGSSGINRGLCFTHATLPRLRKLNLGDHEILQWISAPALEDLQINNLDSHPAASISFLALHELSSCVLTRLTLQGMAALHVLTPTLLVRDLASLVELRVYEARYNEDLVQSLTVPATLPVLQRLVMSLMISPHHRYDLPALAAMIECRWNISHQPVTISFSPRDHLYQSILHDDDGALVRRAMETGKLSFSQGGGLCVASEMLR